MKIRVCIISILLLLVITSCNKDEETDGSDKYLLVEHLVLTDGELMSGPERPPLLIDFPTYYFVADSGILRGVINFKINDDLKIILGSGSCLSGQAGGGCGTGLNGITSIPYKKGDFEILKMDENGKIIFEYKEEAYSLNAGEEWVSENIFQDTVMVNSKKSIVKKKVTDRISNCGFLEKSKIKKWQW